MNKQLGATLLVAGCCIGAGMLGIPVVTGTSGFLPSATFFVLAWAFMALCGLVLTELVLSFDLPEVNLLTMSEKTLGRYGKLVASFLFMFLFYAIMTAYVIASAVLLSDYTGIPFGLTSALFVLVMYLLIAKGLRHVDAFNRALMLGLIACYVLLVGFSLPHVELQRLQRAEWSHVIFSLPILVISFGFHNLVPSLATYLEKKESLLKRAICIGSAIPLAIYILWEYIILGIMPYVGVEGWKVAQQQGEPISHVLATSIGYPLIIDLASGFTLFAIATSFLPVSYSFLDFLHDGLREKKQALSRPLLAVIVLAPPLLCALANAHLFLRALEIAGGFCAVTLFGALPALMAWKRQNDPALASRFTIAKKPILAIVLLGTLFIVCVELIHELSV
ncbi:MAG: GerAB/ArcD/ProY family transporter [Verrucomicrobia bacterium]|nr:GerAB/ArcD/ProY family transporter [Verrucomicrobiota bacterium]